MLDPLVSRDPAATYTEVPNGVSFTALTQPTLANFKQFDCDDNGNECTGHGRCDGGSFGEVRLNMMSSGDYDGDGDLGEYAVRVARPPLTGRCDGLSLSLRTLSLFLVQISCFSTVGRARQGAMGTITCTVIAATAILIL